MIVSVSEPPPYAHLTLGARKWSLGLGSKTQGTRGRKSETFSLQSDFVPERLLSSRQGAASQVGGGPTVCVASRCRAATVMNVMVIWILMLVVVVLVKVVLVENKHIENR